MTSEEKIDLLAILLCLAAGLIYGAIIVTVLKP